MDRILTGCYKAPFSVHDLCRVHGEGDWNAVRMNMPIELGICLGMEHLKKLAGTETKVAFLIQESTSTSDKMPELDRYASNLRGYDPKAHRGTPESLVEAVHDLVITSFELDLDVMICSVEGIIKLLPLYKSAIDNVCRENRWTPFSMPWKMKVKTAIELAKEQGFFEI